MAASPATPAPTIKHLRRRHLTGGSHLPREEPAKVVSRFDNSTITGDVRHGRQRVHLLRPADPGHHVHRDDRGALILGLRHQLFVRRRIEEGNQRLPFGQLRRFGVRRRLHLGNDLGVFPDGGTRNDLHTGSLVIGIRESGSLARPFLDQALMAQLLQIFRTLRRHRHPCLAGCNFLWHSDFHVALSPVSSSLALQVDSVYAPSPVHATVSLVAGKSTTNGGPARRIRRKPRHKWRATSILRQE